jgi:hypothetical protein
MLVWPWLPALLAVPALPVVACAGSVVAAIAAAAAEFMAAESSTLT